MNKNQSIERSDKTMKVRFSIRAKLVLIISIIVLISLGSITALVSYLVYQDLRVLAEENNFEVNRRAALLTEKTLGSVRSASLTFIRTIYTGGELDAPAGEWQQEAAQIFFEENPQIAAIRFTGRGHYEAAFTGENFFLTRGIESYLADLWFDSHIHALRRSAAGEVLLLNAAPYFAIPMLALVFPWQQGNAALVLFSSGELSDAIGFGINQSYLINGEGDILVHPDFDLVRYGTNIAEDSFIRDMRRSPQRNLQVLFTDDDGLRHFAAFTKLDLGAAAVITSIEFNTVFEGLVETTWRNIYLTIAVLSISIIVIWFFAKGISIPLRALAASARDIENGIFEVNLKTKSRDETGVLTKSFQNMSAALRVFGKFTNRDLAVRAMRGELKPGGQPRHATIFFSDIRGFTSRTEAITREFGEEASDRVVFWLNNYLSQMVECVQKTGGVVDKFIGDGVMAHWGTAYTSGNPGKDAFNCIKAALMMRIAVAKMNRERNPLDKANPSILIGCGINTGIVTAGQIGSDLRMEYTVIGDTVNLASRIESQTRLLGVDILIGENTWNLVKDYVIVEEMPPAELKGVNKPVRLFAVINIKGASSGPRSLADVRKLMGIGNG